MLARIAIEVIQTDHKNTMADVVQLLMLILLPSKFECSAMCTSFYRHPCRQMYPPPSHMENEVLIERIARTSIHSVYPITDHQPTKNVMSRTEHFSIRSTLNFIEVICSRTILLSWKRACWHLHSLIYNLSTSQFLLTRLFFLYDEPILDRYRFILNVTKTDQ